MRETVEARLTSLAADLIKAREQAKWGGSEIAVRVIAPNVLISRIVEARDEITSLRAQLVEARRKAIEECAVRVLIVAESNRMKHSQTPELVSRDQVADILDRIEKSIRALLSAPTEERGRE